MTLARHCPRCLIYHALTGTPPLDPLYACSDRCDTERPLLYHLVLVAINAHFAVADNKGIDRCDVAHRTRGQYAIQPSCECVRILLKHLQP